ncbi:MAG TPA: hypothetical protein VGR28_08120 [Candidatus Thermoplasmatota archaeon]|jgi:hypothetical protein|nr:hypothetical protein [Candidatus Thermoplasmatota archaeon]
MLVSPDAPEASPPGQPRRVLDWHSREVGHVLGAHRDPRTHQIDSLLVRLSPEARARIPARGSSMIVPMRRVFGLRRDEITLDCSLEEFGALAGRTP